ncbi:MAG: tRNA (guanosine(46)-N7)-methyltransferase TrmB [Rhizobiales bacterium]|nr:tRNA (guanosine(46)-N7)-methyltransferase TrmB [Hyphomicrobiales bacterium]
MTSPMPDADERKSDVKRAFFGRRKGRPLRPHQSDLLATLLPRLAIDLNAARPGDLRALFSPLAGEVRLEIGFGGGEHLLAAAAADPGAGFIGCEAFVNGMAKVLAGVEAQQIANVRLHFGDAVELLHWLPDGSITRVDLLYPDPWPKRRHWKRRFVQDASVAAIARILQPGGQFRFATDIADYAAWTLVRMLRSPDFVWTAERADDWRKPWPGHAGTRYEKKALRERRAPCYLAFRRR